MSEEQSAYEELTADRASRMLLAMQMVPAYVRGCDRTDRVLALAKSPDLLTRFETEVRRGRSVKWQDCHCRYLHIQTHLPAKLIKRIGLTKLLAAVPDDTTPLTREVLDDLEEMVEQGGTCRYWDVYHRIRSRSAA